MGSTLAFYEGIFQDIKPGWNPASFMLVRALPDSASESAYLYNIPLASACAGKHQHLGGIPLNRVVPG